MKNNRDYFFIHFNFLIGIFNEKICIKNYIFFLKIIKKISDN